MDDDTVAFWRGTARTGLVVARLRGSGKVRVPGLGAMSSRLIDTEDAAFASDPQPAVIDGRAGTIAFTRPGALVLGAV